MRYLKTFEELISQKGTINDTVINWCDGVITESEFIEFLNQSLINEGFSDFVKGFKDKVVDMFYTFVVKAYQIGLAIYDKVSVFIKWLISKVKTFREKNPTTFKIMVITLIIIIILIVSASSAKAATTGTPIPTAKIDMAIGWLDSLKGGKEDPMLLNKAIAHLVDLRDGQVNIQGLGSEAVNMANAALNTADKIMTSANTETDPAFFKFCVGLIEKGRDYVDAIYTNSSNFEGIKLVMK